MSDSRRVLLGITGSIAAYKTPHLVRRFVKSGFSVKPILTDSAEWFVTSLALASVSGHTPQKTTGTIGDQISHLSLARDADLFVVAPASANTIAKLANGIADDLLSSTFLSFQGPKLIVPAMHTEMYENSITQDNIQKLKAHGVQFLGPDEGDLACGDSGKGRMVSEDLIVECSEFMLMGPLDIAGKTIVVTAGGTSEPIDSVRVISNSSTGLLGHSIAKLAGFWGAKVTLISTKAFSDHALVSKFVSVDSVASLKMAVEIHSGDCDLLFMAAAVSDFSVTPSDVKINRQSGFHLELEGTPDILRSVSQSKREEQTFVGFCLESADKLDVVAPEKLVRKGVDYIVANAPGNIGQQQRSFKIFDQSGLKASYSDLGLFESAKSILALA